MPAPAPAESLLSRRFLGRLGLALIALFLINTLFGLLPLRLLDSAWQLQTADLLRTTAPFCLLGAALLYLYEGPAGGPQLSLLPLRRIQRLAPLAALGFLLLIPLQFHASYMQIRNAESAAQATIRSVERRIQAVRSAASAEQLLELSQGLPEDWQPIRGASLDSNRGRLLARVEPELSRLRSNASRNRNAAIQKSLKAWLRDALLSLVYAAAFFGLRPLRFAPVPLHQVGFHDDDPDSPSTADRGNADHPASPESDEPDLREAEQHPWYP